VNVAPNSTFEAVIDTGEPGLAGMITVEANDNTSTTVIAPTAAGIIEIAAGVYAAAGLAAPAAGGQYTLIWKHGAEVLGIEDLTVTFSAPGPPVPTGGPYVDISELQRVLGKTSPTAAETDAMNRVLAAAAAEIDWDLGYTVDNPAPASDIVAAVNLERAAELWRFSYSTSGVLPQGPELGPVIAPRDTWHRHHLRLSPLRVHVGIA